ncbi:MAG: DUF3015 family protein [Planctomycetota bacterium]
MNKLILTIVVLMTTVSIQAANVNSGAGAGADEFSDGQQSASSSSSNTSGSKQDSGTMSNERLHVFVRDNINQLRREIIAGKGWSIETLADIMLVPPVNRPAFVQNLQRNINQINASPTVIRALQRSVGRLNKG